MTIAKPHLLTSDGLKKLTEELDYLRTIGRESIADRLHNAFEDGQDDDFVENAELELKVYFEESEYVSWEPIREQWVYE